MWRVALTQMRASAPRLAAAALTIVLGSAFVATTLLAGATMTDITHRSLVASYAEADLVVGAEEGLSLDQIEELRAVAGVQAADPVALSSAEVDTGERSVWTTMAPAPVDERLSVATLQEGRFPEAAGEVALVADVAERLGVATGGTVTLGWDEVVQEDAADGPAQADPARTVRIVGLVTPPSSYFLIGPQLFTDADTFAVWAHFAEEMNWTIANEAVALLADGADPQQVRADIEAALPQATVQTVAERAEQLAAMYTGDETLLTAIGVGFAVVALAVAALVIANTFTVLVAQRTRTLALLRCVGASAAQVRRSVLLEAAVLGLLSAGAGLGLAVAVVAVGLRLLGRFSPDLPMGTDVLLSPGIVLATLLTGLLVTLGAATVPARLATRVAPLAALQPVEGAPERRAGRVRAICSAAGVVLGAGLLGAAVIIARRGGEMDVALLALGIGVLGGLLAVLGLLLGAVFVVPELIQRAGRVAGRGVTARTATANAIRHPRRTAATASALLIGVGLVTMMSTGAATTQTALSRTLAEQLSVDLTMDGGGAALSGSHLDLLREHPQITEVAVLEAAPARLDLDSGERFDVQAATIQEGSVREVVRDPGLSDRIEPGTVVLPRVYQDWFGVQDGQEVTLAGADGTQEGLRVQLSGIDGTALVAPEVLADLSTSSQASVAWAQVADDADELDVIRDLQAALADDPGAPVLGGSGVERAAYEQIIDTLLLIVLALLGVSVIIALVGVANTLSLSVLERRRESAMLRALGLSRGQLRATLAIEALLIAGVGAVVGIVIGLAFGWAGSAVLLAGIGEVPLVVPWREVGIVLAVALVAGLLASVLPARSAVRAAPVEALAGP